jgi:hypothetical protein
MKLIHRAGISSLGVLGLVIMTIGGSLAACSSVPSGQSFTVTVGSASWSKVQAFMSSSKNNGAYSSAADLIFTYLCENESGSDWLGPIPTEVGKTASGVEFRVTLTSNQVAQAQSAINSASCAANNGISTVQQDYESAASDEEIAVDLRASKSSSSSSSSSPSSSSSTTTTTTTPSNIFPTRKAVETTLNNALVEAQGFSPGWFWSSENNAWQATTSDGLCTLLLSNTLKESSNLVDTVEMNCNSENAQAIGTAIGQAQGGEVADMVIAVTQQYAGSSAVSWLQQAVSGSQITSVNGVSQTFGDVTVSMDESQGYFGYTLSINPAT